jgi:DNA-binding Xre family transcriptional regulator
MAKRGATTYTLRNKGRDDNISGSTIMRLQNNESVSTNTLNTLCKTLDCRLPDIVEYIPE